MPLTPRERASIATAVQKRVSQIMARHRKMRKSCKAALEKHPIVFSRKAELTRIPSGKRAGARGVNYPVSDALTNLDDQYGYNVESIA